MADATACGSSAKPAVTTVTTTAAPTANPSSTSTPDTLRPSSPSTVNANGAATVTATDKDKGATIPAKVGDRVNVVLASTYWNFAAVSDASVLKIVGAPVPAPRPGCVPGSGCGTVTASYDAIAPGTAVVSASRTSCGEAMGCSAAAGSYRVTINVAPS